MQKLEEIRNLSPQLVSLSYLGRDSLLSSRESTSPQRQQGYAKIIRDHGIRVGNQRLLERLAAISIGKSVSWLRPRVAL